MKERDHLATTLDINITKTIAVNFFTNNQWTSQNLAPYLFPNKSKSLVPVSFCLSDR